MDIIERENCRRKKQDPVAQSSIPLGVLMLSFPSPVSLCARSTCAVEVVRWSLIRPLQRMMLVSFWSKRKGGELWKNPEGVPFSFRQSHCGLFIHCSLSLSSPCVVKPSLLSPGFSLSSQSPRPEGPSSPVMCKSSVYSSALLPSSPSFCC